MNDFFELLLQLKELKIENDLINKWLEEYELNCKTADDFLGLAKLKSNENNDAISKALIESKDYFQCMEILEFIKNPIVKVFTKLDLPSKIDIPTEDNVVKISSIEKAGFENLIEKVTSILPI